jgi:hypothetical protein
MHNSALINLNVVHEAAKKSVKRVFYSSSACMYPEHNQLDPNNPNCEESSAYPANPDSEYGWEKLFSERLFLAFNRNYKLDVRVARFHNIFGPMGTWTGGKEKAPAAMCRKAAESDNAKTQVDFCWDINYIQMEQCMSDVYNNASAQQAWRAGFREGVKMGLLEGSKADDIVKQVHWKNFQRLLVWMHVGMDVKNGEWAIYGARQGCYMTNCTDWDFVNVRDFKWLNNYWSENDSKVTEKMLPYEIMGIGETLKHELNMSVADPFNNEQSRLFKSLYTNPPRMKNTFIVGS